MKFEQLKPYLEKPAPFTSGEPLFWDDPHISTQMLQAHLDPGNDLASRRPETIQKTVGWLMSTLELQAGDAVLDLGCGPGLYATCLAEHGLRVTGIDYSRNSIEYAQAYAREHNIDISYRYQDYRTLTDENLYDAVLLIYGDYCPLSGVDRQKLCQNVLRSLKVGGFFVLDVTTRHHRAQSGNRNQWYVSNSGFWKSVPHLVLEEGFDYPELDIFLDQAIVIEESGKVSVYRNWFQDFSKATITRELEENDFAIHSVWGDLTGQLYREDTPWIGVIARKKG